MPKLQWDDLDFLECLEVVPEVETDRIWYSYQVVKNGLDLQVKVWPMESVIQFALARESAKDPLFRFALFVRGRVRHINDKRGEYLEFEDCVVASNQFWYIEAGDVFNHGRFAKGVTVEIGIKPDIWIEFT